jgi:DNA-binding NtrC family response regulator/tetratricopeptide (TPR) repeat protein
LPIKERAVVSLYLASAYCANHNYPSAIGLFNESIKCSTQVGDKALEAKARCQLGMVYASLSEYVIAQEHLQQALKTFTRSNDKQGEAQVYLYIGQVLIGLGEFDKSIEYHQKSITLSLNVGAQDLQTQAKASLGRAYLLKGNPRKAVEFYQVAIKEYEQRQKNSLVVKTYNDLAYSLIVCGEWQQAEKLLEKSLFLARQKQDDQAEAFALVLYGLIYTLTERTNEAKPTLSFALELLRQVSDKDCESLCNISVGKLQLALEEKSLAVAHLKTGLDLALSIGRTDYAIEAQLTFIELCVGENKLDAALAAIEKANSWLEGRKNSLLEAKVLFSQAQIEIIQGKNPLSKLEQAIEVFEAFSLPCEKALCFIERAKLLQNKQDMQLRVQTDLTRALNILSEIKAKSLIAKTNLLEKVQNFSKTISKKDAEISSLLIAQNQYIQRLIKSIHNYDEVLKEIVFALEQQTQADLVAIFDMTVRSPMLITASKVRDLLLLAVIPRLERAILEKTTGWIAGRDIDEPIYLETCSILPEKEIGILFWGVPNKLINAELISSFISLVKELVNLPVAQVVEQIEPDETETEKLKSFKNLPELVYSSKKMADLVDQITRIHSSDLTVLITGESGTGKDLIAKAVHLTSERRNKPFSPFNCTATPQEIVEAQLFGYRKGAFTGANTDYEGVIRAVEGGTLLLDEIGDLRLNIQPKLLRFLQDGEIQPVGYARPLRVNVRIIASTNRDLEEMVESGEFREDLYHRLNILRLVIPPLRQRREEIIPLAKYFLKESCKRTNKHIVFGVEALKMIGTYDWPGNVRQLKNEIERMVAFASENDIIGKKHLSSEIVQATAILKPSGQLLEKSTSIQFQPGMSLDEILMQMEKEIILRTLKECRGNIRRTSSILGISRKGLYDKIKRLKINY